MFYRVFIIVMNFYEGGLNDYEGWMERPKVLPQLCQV